MGCDRSQQGHEVIGSEDFLPVTPVDVGQRCAHLAEAEIRAGIGQSFQTDKRQPLGNLAAT